MTDAEGRNFALPWLAIWIGPVLALVWYGPTLWGSFLSDDFQLNAMLTRGEAPGVDWAQILADFGRSWAGLEGADLYRPLVSLSFALSFTLSGADPIGYHALNILVHAGASLACALLCARTFSSRPALAAAVGGAVFALHPIGAEPGCWVAARNSGLQVLFATSALACFAGYLRVGSARRAVAAAGCTVLALLTKETGVLLPALFLILDALAGEPRSARSTWRFHAVAFAILAGYFCLRRSLFGAWIGGGGPGVQTLHGAPLQNVLDKATMLFAPTGQGLAPPWGWIVGGTTALGLALVVIPALRRSRLLWILIGSGVWIGLCLAPSFRLQVDPGTLSGSRLVYGAVVALAFLVAGIAAGLPDRRPVRVGIAVLLVGLGILGWARIGEFRQVFATMHTLQARLADHTPAATPARPIVFVNVNPPPLGITFLNSNALFALAERPIAAKDTPTVSLGFVFEPVPGSEPLLHHTGPMRALQEQGGLLLDWVPPKFYPRPIGPGPESLPPLRESEPGRFLAPTVLSPWAVEEVEVEVSGSCTGGSLTWLFTADGDPTHGRDYSTVPLPERFRAAAAFAPFPPGERRGENTVFRVDVSTYLSFLAIESFGGLAGFAIQTEGQTARTVAVRLQPRVGTLDLVARLDDREIPLPSTETGLRAPALPPGAESMSLYLIGPDTTLRVDHVRPGPVHLDESVQAALQPILQRFRQRRYYYYFEARGTRSHRSPLDWFRFR